MISDFLPAFSTHDKVHIAPGTANVMIRGNYIRSDDSDAIAVPTFVREHYHGADGPALDRVVKNVFILNNTVLDAGTTGSFLSVMGKTPGVLTVKNNLFVAPDLVVGPYATAAVRVENRNDMKNFTSLASGGGVDGNVWNLPAQANSVGVNYITDRPAGTAAYRTPDEWAHDFPDEVGRDTFERLHASDLAGGLVPPTTSAAATAANPVPGVFSDLEGQARPLGKTWSAGAVQVESDETAPTTVVT